MIEGELEGLWIFLVILIYAVFGLGLWKLIEILFWIVGGFVEWMS